MVLAHNEERHIEKCLTSIFASEPGRSFDVFVMANGCSDHTEDIVRAYSRRQAGVHLVSISLGDKCNAWNVFVHEIAPVDASDREIYFFMDGDAQVVGGSFSAMAAGLTTHPHANAASAVPGSGRNASRDGRELLVSHGLVANLYALRGAFVERLREHSIRIPLRLEGDDGLIGALIKWDLDPRGNAFDDQRIVPCADACFTFESMSLLRPGNWRAYWKRSVRYARRKYEFELLGPRLKAEGLAGMPIDITEIYGGIRGRKLKWSGAYTASNWIALREMRKAAEATAQSRLRTSLGTDTG